MTAIELEFSEVDVPPVLALQVHEECPDPRSIGLAIKTAFGTLWSMLHSHALTPAGPPRVIYESFGATGISFTLAIPVAPAAEAPRDPSVELKTLHATKAYRFAHHGSYHD